MDAILVSLLLWINQNTHLDYNVRYGIPKLLQAEQITMAAIIIDDQAAFEKDRHTASFQNFVDQLEAVYDHKHQAILISSKTDLHSAYARSVIVHELVHFIQYRQGLQEQVPCLNALERDAYEIQALYMDAFDIAKNFDKATIAMRSMCWDYTE